MWTIAGQYLLGEGLYYCRGEGQKWSLSDSILIRKEKLKLMELSVDKRIDQQVKAISQQLAETVEVILDPSSTPEQRRQASKVQKMGYILFCSWIIHVYIYR